ncbi:hypothetical protein CVT25_006347, partial [Psilocybe cyanescens]
CRTTDKKNARLSNPTSDLVDVFDAPATIRTIRARVVEGKQDLSAKYDMQVADDNRKLEGTPCTVADLEEFKKNWVIFTERSLSQPVNWNIIAILSPRAPLSNCDTVSKRAIRKYYHSNAYPTSDVDLFLWGMTPDQDYECSIARMEGLARLLALEKLADENMRNTFLKGRRQLRGRIFANALSQKRNKRTRQRDNGDLKDEKDSGTIEMNDYDVASLHLPYRPGWNARRIDKLVYQTDLGMDSIFNLKKKGRRLHRHHGFFGTVEDDMEDCCENSPKPIDDDEKKLQAEENEAYIRGRIQFIEENPARQSITGSFKPIDISEWSEQVYINPVQELFTAIAAHDRATVQRLLSESLDVNQRDHVGRTYLHVAIFSKTTDIALDLIDAGSRITAPMADGRAPLHRAAQFDQDQNVVFAIATAISRKHYGIVALLLAQGAKLDLDERDISRAQGATSRNIFAYQSLEVALKNHDDLIKLLISLNASINFGLLESSGSIPMYPIGERSRKAFRKPAHTAGDSRIAERDEEDEDKG